MSVMLPKKFQDRLQNIPTSMQFSNSNKSLKYGELLSAIDLMSKEKAIVFDIGEFHREYGKHSVAVLKKFAKKTNVPFVLRVVIDKTDSKILFFKNDKRDQG